MVPFQKVSLEFKEENEKMIRIAEIKELEHLYKGGCICEKPCQNVKNILIMGETGAGKTTYVDSFLNYLLGIDYYDKFRYKMVDESDLIAERNEKTKKAGNKVEEAKAAQTHSMTSSVSIYHIPSTELKRTISKEACCINFIDTPGFGDTRGAAWDEKIEKMISAMLHEVLTLDYIAIVVKSTENRLKISSKFIYTKISNMYAVDITTRLMGMITFSDGGKAQFEEGLVKAGINLKEKFMFNNS